MPNCELLSDGIDDIRSKLGPMVSNNFLGNPKIYKKLFI
jgi:hypothetical protein